MTFSDAGGVLFFHTKKSKPYEATKLNINIKLDHNFTAAFNKLSNENATLARLNGFSESQLSYTDFIDNFIDKNTVADSSIDGNANVATKDVCSLLSEMNKPHLKLLAFNKIFFEMNKKWGFQTANDWLKSEWNGEFYLHDASTSTSVPYCYAYDLEDLATKGLYFIEGFNPQPPEHLVTWTDFVGEFVSWTANRSSGACGLPSFLIYSFYFWRKDVSNGYYTKNPDYYRDQEFQRIIYKLNQPYLRVNQSAFTNFTIFDKNYLVELFGGKEFPDGSFMIDAVDDILEYQKRFMEVLADVRAKNAMTFPVMTYSLLFQNGKFVNEDYAKWCCKHNMRWGDANFATFDDVTSLSNCCRLVSDVKKLGLIGNSMENTQAETEAEKEVEKFFHEQDSSKTETLEEFKSCIVEDENLRSICEKRIQENFEANHISSDPKSVLMSVCGFHEEKKLGYAFSIGGTALSVGSVKVNTINLARIAYSNSKEEYFDALREKVRLNLKCLDTVRSIIKRNNEKNLLPNYAKHVMLMSNQYNTVGIIGIFETMEKYGFIRTDELGYTTYTDEGVEFAKKILAVIREEADLFREQNHCDYQINVEQVPAERAASILMAKDKLFFPDEKYTLPLYANQWIPLAVKTTIKEKVRISAILDKACNGGSIAHINIATPFKTFEEAWDLLNFVASAGCNYFAFCYRISVCKTNHSFFGETCPYCGEPKYTTVQRIVGFLVPEKNYSKERKEEYWMRYFF